MLQMLRDNAGRIGMGLLFLMAFGIGAIASSKVSEHDQAQSAHMPQFEIIAKSIRKNRSDMDVQQERNEQRYQQVQESLKRQETADVRMNQKLDRILEKL